MLTLAMMWVSIDNDDYNNYHTVMLMMKMTEMMRVSIDNELS